MASKERKMISIKDKELHKEDILWKCGKSKVEDDREKVGLWGTLVTVRNH